MMEIGISSYTYNWWAGMTPADLLGCAAELKVGVVQIADNMPLHLVPPGELESLRAEADRLGIKIETGTCGIRPERLRQYLEISRKLGATFLRTLIDAPGDEPGEDEVVSMLREIAPEFARAGVTLGIENHDRFPARTLRSIVERTASEAVGICLDTANSLGCGEGIEHVTEILKDYVVNLHVKDITIRRLPHKKGFVVEGAPAGKGLIDIPKLLAALDRPDRRLSVIAELWSSPEVERQWAQESVRYLQDLITASSCGCRKRRS
jgi:sugar phosphate isomerase/epimerase